MSNGSHRLPLLVGLARRLAIAVAQIMLVSLLVFVVMAAAPGNAAENLAGDGATAEQVAQVRSSLGLDDPVLVQYGRWLSHAARGDLGDSLRTKEAVVSILGRGLPVTASIALVALAIAAVVALIAGTMAVTRPGGWIDRCIGLVSSLGVAIPGFWVALVLVAIVAVKFGLLPAVGYVPLTEDPVEWFRHIILPALALSLVPAAELTRQLRASMHDALASDYALASRAKGVSDRRLVYKHAMKNALAPVVAVLGVRVSQLIGTGVVIESVFNISGLGLAGVRATLARDIPVILGITVLSSILVLVCGLIADVAQSYLNPRLRSS